MLNVYFLRHGQTPFNADGNRYCGRTDAPLTEKGIRQAMDVRDQLRNIALDAAYASPLQRAFQTAKIAAGSLEVKADDRLIEVDFGQWEGKKREEFVAEDPDLWHQWDLDPMHARAGGTGETASEVIHRVDDFFREALQRHPSGNILVAAHNGVNRLYLAWKLGMPVKNYRRIVQENSSITLFTLDEAGELTLQLLNARLS
ncbi:MAG TPA: histidine phosphatase family protein [Puia sp.]|nr:histidine phosphatase family protein [Puia sp.]